MSIRLGCVKCNQPFQVGDETAGQVVRCPSCQQAMRVPKAPPKEVEPVATAELIEDDPPPEERPRRRRDRLDEGVRELRRREAETNRTPQLDDEVPAEADELGRPIYLVDKSTNYRLFGIICWVIAGVICVPLLLILVSSVTLGRFGVGELAQWLLPLGAAVLGGVFFMMGKAKSMVWICPGGLAWVKGKDVSFAPWEDVRFFQPRSTTTIYKRQSLFGEYETGRNTQHSCTIGFRGNLHFDFTSEDHIEFLHRQVLKTLFPLYSERLDAGERVRLVPFELTAKGIALDGRRLGWDEVQEVEIHNNVLSVLGYDRRDRLEVNLTEVDLAVVLVAVASELARRARPAPRRESSRDRDRDRDRRPRREEPEERNPFDFS